MPRDFHVQLHVIEDEKVQVLFEAQVYANDSGEAHEKVRKHLHATGQHDILDSYQRYSSLEIQRRCNPDLLRLE